MHRTITRLLTICTLGSALYGCGYLMVRPFAAASPVPNWVGLHQNPVVGDYAIHKQLNGGYVRYRIEGRTQTGLFIVSQEHVRVYNPCLWGVADSRFEVHVDAEGWVKRAFFVDLTFKSRTPLRVAGPGEAGYISDPKVITKEKAIVETVKTAAGTFAVRKVRVMKMQRAGVEAVVVHLIHPRAKFQIVRLTVTAEVRAPYLKILQALQRYQGMTTNLNQGQRLIMNLIRGKARQSSFFNRAELVEQN